MGITGDFDENLHGVTHAEVSIHGQRLFYIMFIHICQFPFLFQALAILQL